MCCLMFAPNDLGIEGCSKRFLNRGSYVPLVPDTFSLGTYHAMLKQLGLTERDIR